jgi:hypothetical protein
MRDGKNFAWKQNSRLKLEFSRQYTMSEEFVMVR